MISYAYSVKGKVVVFDVEGAYVKSRLGGARTFGRLNRRLWPQSWHGKYTRPVLPVWMALYGLPRAGFDWDDSWGVTVEYIGFIRVHDTEGSMWVFRSEEGIAVLCIYVDDGVIGGPTALVDRLVAKIQEWYILKIQDGLVITILGMNITTIYQEDRILVAFRMSEYLANMHRDFLQCTGKAALRKYATPEWPENYDFGSLHETFGLYHDFARKFIGRILYVVRAVRVESFHAVIVIATEIESWDAASDSKLERLVSYMYETRERGPTWEFFFSDGCDPKDIWYEEESDADHGSCLRTGRSFSGWLTWFRHGSLSKGLVDFGCLRQKVAAISTAHSELGALKDSWTKSLLPAVGAWEQCLGREMYARHLIDSDAARKAVNKGLSIALRYLRKAARISLAALHDISKSIDLHRVESKDNRSDILTKPMDQETLTRHLFALGYFALEWRRSKSDESRSLMIALGRHLRNALIHAFQW